LPLNNGLIIKKILQSKKLLIKELGAQIHVCVKTIPEIFFHEVHGVECLLLLYKTKNFDRDNINLDYKSLWLKLVDEKTLQ
jgi:hypothetical protein